METVYREFSGGQWHFWTYAQGLFISLSQRQFDLMKRQGAKVVTA